ncbi:MAG: DUF488 domain-containing protein [Chloroflexi bacterium]|nr:DUF488 domain-containing protein [Chloroflexota bacterium]
MTNIYTIGHSNHTWEGFAELMAKHDIEILVDARSNPVSRYAPFSNHRTLPDLLEGVGIEYMFFGGPLGGKPKNEAFYDEKGKPDYHKMRATDEFDEAVDTVASMARRSNVVLLCSEEDPAQCHRLLLVGPAMEQRSVDMLHIRASGETQTTSQLGIHKKYNKQIQGTLPL